MSNVRPITKHLVVEMRYDPTLAFYGLMDKIGLDLIKHYPDWERSALTLEIRDKKHKRRCFLGHQRCFFEAVDFTAEATELEQASKLLEKMHFELRFTKVRRFGVRRLISVAATEPYAELVRNVAAKFHPKSERLDKMLRGKLEDVAYVVDVRTDLGWRYHLRVGPMERKQWFELIPYEIGIFNVPEDFPKYRDSFPERMYFIDLDCYQEDIAFSDIAPVMAATRQASAEMVSELMQYLKGEDHGSALT